MNMIGLSFEKFFSPKYFVSFFYFFIGLFVLIAGSIETPYTIFFQKFFTQTYLDNLFLSLIIVSFAWIVLSLIVLIFSFEKWIQKPVKVLQFLINGFVFAWMAVSFIPFLSKLWEQFFFIFFIGSLAVMFLGFFVFIIPKALFRKKGSLIGKQKNKLVKEELSVHNSIIKIFLIGLIKFGLVFVLTFGVLIHFAGTVSQMAAGLFIAFALINYISVYGLSKISLN
ncbi:MAG: hypothetical protein Q7S92_06410 [Candidatus Diapherotrites archaeon]|nr:hypothetical protein [Candidatus Diapherotrites archaeon]